MRRLLVAGFTAVLGTAALASSASAVPSFVRQTGLTCNQCHVTFANVPDFTFTGKKFRLNGYRTPYIAEKIEAGEEGALSGNRLVMGIQNIFSLRFRNVFLSQSKSASDKAGPEAEAGPVETNPGSSISWFYVGGIGEHIGIWNEFYLINNGNASSSAPNAADPEAARSFRIETFDEYDVKFTMNPGYDNIVGIGVSTQALNAIAGFSPFSSGTPNHMQRGGLANAHTSYLNMFAYGLIKDRVLVAVGVQPGEDNFNFSNGMNYQTVLGYALGNTDHNQLWYVFQLKAGTDAIPIVTNPSINSDRLITYNDAIQGVRQTRSAVTTEQVAYVPEETGDFVRTLQEIHYGFVDKGPHSLSSAAGFSYNRETYEDGAEIKHSAIGGRVRYYYDRTYGVEYNFSKALTYEFTDVNGVEHSVSKPFNGTSISLFYRPAMNFSVGLTAGINTSSGTRLDDNREFRKGWSWSILYDFMF
jgi:hypothetical protein